MNGSIHAIAAFMPHTYWVIISSLILTLADIMLRNWFETQWSYGFPLILGIYFIGIFALVMGFFGQNIALVTMIGIVLNIVFYLAYSYFAYGDALNWQQMLGILLGFAAIYLLEFSKAA